MTLWVCVWVGLEWCHACECKGWWVWVWEVMDRAIVELELKSTGV